VTPPATVAVRLGVSVIAWDGDRVLLIQRGKAPGIGLWAPIGGMVEPGETLVAAAARETREETGATIADLDHFTMRELIHRDADGALERHVVLAVFTATLAESRLEAGDDAIACGLFTRDEAAALPLVPGVMAYIEAARVRRRAGSSGAIVPRV
jgi:ADP-ribose pyrophosphatase YjhB (NUDIX family)